MPEDQVEGIRRIRIVAGLGNPGSRYAGTRHNVGFRVLDALALRWNAVFSLVSRWQADCAQHDGLLLIKPLTFMNRSGEPLSGLSRFYRIDPPQVLVVVDDTALPVGTLRLRLRGSAGGHNGLRSVIQHFGTEDFPRLRIGVGSPETGPLEKFVLARFTSAEEDAIGPAVIRAAEATDHACKAGIESAMNIYNKTNIP